MRDLLFVCAGGAAGSGSRYLIGLAFARALAGPWPWATLTVNLLGAFAIELVLALVLGGTSLPEPTKLLLATGFMGGFTTYSTFNHEVLGLARNGHVATAIGYFFATAVGALALGMLGYWLGRSLWPAG